MKRFENLIIKRLIIFSFLIITSIFSSCKQENMCDCIKRTGAVETTKRWASNFDKIYLEDNLNVIITLDSTFDVQVEAGKNIGWLIETEVADGTLRIKNKNRCNWTRTYKQTLNVYVKMPAIKLITSNGSGKISSANTITSNNLEIAIESSGNVDLTVNNAAITSRIFGAGDLTLHGYTHEHACDIGGAAYLNCKDLQTFYSYIHTYTSGICYVSAINQLSCKIDRVGDIYCYSHPPIVDKVRTGDGELYFP